MEVKVRDIVICFSDAQKKDIDRIQTIIQNNYELLFEALDDKKIIDISQDEMNFDDFFRRVVCLIYDEATKQQLADKKIISALHIEALIRKNKYYGTCVVNRISNISDETLLSLIAYKYFEINGSFEDFIEYLKIRNNKEEIFQWFHATFKWDTYNNLLSILIFHLENRDQDFFNHLEVIQKWLICQENECEYENPEIDYPKISEKEFDNLFYEFLDYINAPEEWKNIYDKLKENKLIIKETKSDYNTSMCFRDKDGIIKILIDFWGNIKSFFCFVHEFVHYVSAGKRLPFSLISEFPSIFFEKIAIEFLKEKGYSDEVCNQMSKQRFYNSLVLLDNYEMLMKYRKYGYIDRKDLIKHIKEQIDALNEKRKKELESLINAGEEIKDPSVFEQIDIDAEKYIDEGCDEGINSIIEKGVNDIDGYCHFLDFYLAEQVLERRNVDCMVVQKMIDVTIWLDIMNLNDVLSLFKLENLFQEDQGEGTLKREL